MHSSWSAIYFNPIFCSEFRQLIWCIVYQICYSDIQLFYYYTNLNSLIICCHFSGDMYLSFGTSILSSFCECNSSKCDFLEDFFKTLVILSAILLPIKSPVASAVFFNCSFWSSVYCIRCRFFSTIKRFLTIFIA